jgi:DNA-binding MarR family transcriptional regulator
LPFDPERFAGLAGFRSALRQFLAASETISRAGGVTAQQYQALLAIGCGQGPMTMKDLAEQLLLQQNAATQMVDRLQKAGLVDRDPSATDGRSVVLTLTPTGGALLARLAEQHLAEMLKQEPHLSRSLRRLKQAGQPADPRS